MGRTEEAERWAVMMKQWVACCVVHIRWWHCVSTHLLTPQMIIISDVIVQLPQYLSICFAKSSNGNLIEFMGRDEGGDLMGSFLHGKPLSPKLRRRSNCDEMTCEKLAPSTNTYRITLDLALLSRHLLYTWVWPFNLQGIVLCVEVSPLLTYFGLV